MAASMISTLNVREWSPVLLALEYPQYFYPILILGFSVAAVAWWLVPQYSARRWYPTDPANRQAAESSFRRDLSLFYTGSVVVLGILGAVIQFVATLDRNHQQEVDTLSATNSTSFSQAITNLQLDSPLAVLSAISALSALAHQDGFYWGSTVELNELLREAIPKRDVNSLEIHNALYVLSQRDAGIWTNRLNEPFPLDFSNLNLSGLKFSSLMLWGSDFRYANLSGSYLPGTLMEGTDFTCTNFEGANLKMSTLYAPTHASEIGPKLEKANFRHADLSNVQFMGDKNNNLEMYTTDACFDEATLDGADLSHFDLTAPSGLAPDKIKRAKSYPPIPAGFNEKPCMPFHDLCPTNPTTK
jgi:uncharacterized protein YjbI with pentapeptide repeats